MSTTTKAAQQVVASHDAARECVTVAVVDGAEPTGAVAWAADAAARLDLPLLMVAAVSLLPDPAAFRPPNARSAELGLESRRRELASLAERLPRGVELLPPVIETGTTMRVVLGHVDEHTRYLVLGHHETHTAQRVLTGSVSIALSGRSPVPVVVVPDEWVTSAHTAQPVVVGVELRHTDSGLNTDHAVLETAFARAHELTVPLLAVHAWEIPPLLSWSPADIATHRHKVQAAFEAFLQPWRTLFPDVEVIAHAVAERPADAVLDAASTAQLVVVGRHTPATRHGGFRLGSTARMVMHHQQVPVLVVPGRVPVAAEGDEDEESFDTCAPMF